MPQLIEVPGHGQVEFPDGMSDEAIAAAIKKNLLVGQPAQRALPKMLGIPPSNQETIAAIQKAKDQGWGSGWPAFANTVGDKAVDLSTQAGLPPGGAAGVGLTADVLTQALPILLSGATVPSAAQGAAGAAQSLLGVPARWLMQKAVKPSTDDLLSGAADKAIRTAFTESIKPTASGMHTAAARSAKLDEQVGQAIAGSNATVPVPAVASRLGDTLKTAEMQVNPKTDTAAVEKAWTEFLTSPHIAGRPEIPVQLAHELKKGTYKALGGKSYGEVGSTSVEAQKALARGLREETMAAVPEIAAPMARQAELMNLRDVAGARALQQANNNVMGLGALRIDHPLSSLSFMADRSAWLKAFLAMQLNAAGKPSTIVPSVMTGGILSNENQPPPFGILSERR